MSLASPVFPAASEKANLLLVTIDTLRADHLGAYGYAGIRTPVIDRLATSGVLFAQAVSHAPLTLPSHITILTGTLPIDHGVRNNGIRLTSSVPTLAEILKRAGWRTGAFVGAFPLDSRFGLGRGFEVYDDHYGSRNQARDLTFVERKADDVNRKALAWMDAHRREAFFAWVHYFDPHAPYEPPPPFDTEYKGREYDGEIASTDAALGRLLKQMDAWGLTGRTLVVLTGDHGESLGEHGEATHGIFIYDATLHVPLLFSGASLAVGGRTIQDQVGLVDIAPTVLEMLGLSAAPGMTGRSLAPLVRGRTTLPAAACYIESLAGMLDRNWAPLQGIRTAAWKYIEAPTPELFDLSADPLETKNVLADHPAEGEKWRGMLQAMIRRAPLGIASATIRPPIDKETQDKLQALGYLGGGVGGSGKSRPDPKSMIALDELFNEAMLASEAGKLDAAARLYERVLDQQPNFLMGYEYAAYNFYKMGKLDAAIAMLRKALAMDLVSTSILSRLGLYEQEAGRLKESIAALEEAVRGDPNDAEARNDLGVSYVRAGRGPEAVVAFTKALDLAPDDARIYNNLGNAHLALKDYEAAAAAYEKAAVADPNLAAAANGLGAVRYRQGRVNEALAQWERSSRIDPKQPDTLYNLGRAYLRLDRKKDALACFEAFIAVASPQKYEKDIEEVKSVIERLKKEIGKEAAG